MIPDVLVPVAGRLEPAPRRILLHRGVCWTLDPHGYGRAAAIVADRALVVRLPAPSTWSRCTATERLALTRRVLTEMAMLTRLARAGTLRCNASVSRDTAKPGATP